MSVKKDSWLVHVLKFFGILAGRCGSVVVRERDEDTKVPGLRFPLHCQSTTTFCKGRTDRHNGKCFFLFLTLPFPCSLVSHTDVLLASHVGEDCVTSRKNVCVGGYLFPLVK